MGFVTISDTISNSVSVPAKSVRPKVYEVPPSVSGATGVIARVT